jgi:branched-chain amino acid transport system ATP-binding protein
MALLDAQRVTKRFGGLIAVDKTDFIIEPRMIASLIGPNGAGKTTFFNCITGFYRPEEGSILFDGHELVGLRPDVITSLGIAAHFRTFASLRI